MNDLITRAEVDRATFEGVVRKVLEVQNLFGAAWQCPVVAGPCDYERVANETLPGIKRFQKEVEAYRKAFKQPFDDAAKRVQEYFRAPGALLEAAERSCKGAISEYLAAEEARRKAYEAEINAKEQLKAELFETEARVIKVPEVMTGGSVSRRTVTKWRITDESKIPREYLCVDEKKLNQLARWGGGKEVPGVEFYEEEILAARAAK